MNSVNHVLYRGIVNKNLRMTYQYQKKDGKYKTVQEYNDSIYIEPAFGISIGEPYGSPNRYYVVSKQYANFVMLLHKSLIQVQSHLTELYQNIGTEETTIDTLTLERFITEKAMRIHGVTIVPCVWSNESSSYPAIEVSSVNGRCRIPLEDAMAIDQTLSTFDPFTFGLLILNMM